MTKAKHLFLYLMAVMLAVGVAGCNKESEQLKDPEPQEKPTPGPGEKPDEGKTDKPFGDLPESVHIFEQVVPVDNDNIETVVCDTINNKFTITFGRDIPEISTGNVIVVRDGDEARVILVKDAKVSNNTVEIDGSLGDYSYVFHDTKFALSCSSPLFEEQHPEVPVCYPEKNSLSKTDKGSFDFDDPKWELTDDEFTFDGGFKIKHNINSNGSATFSLGLHVKAIYWVLLDFKKTTNVYENGVWYKKSEQVKWDYEVYFDHSSVNSGVNLDITGKLPLVQKEHEFIKGFAKGKWFSVWGLPVRIVVGIDFLWDFKASTSGSLSFDLSTELTYTQQMGLYKTEDDDLHINCTNPYFESTITPTLNGNAELSLMASIYPVVYFSLYSKKIGGGGFALKPTFSAKVGAGVTLGGDEDLIANTGMSASAVLGLKTDWGYYREKKEKGKSAIQFTAPAVDEKVPIFTSKPINTFLENSTMSRSDLFYKLETGRDIIDIVAWKTPSKLALMSLSDKEHSMTCVTDEDIDKNHAETTSGNGGGAWGMWDDDTFYFPIRKGQTIKAHFKVLSELLIDLVVKEWLYYNNTPFPYLVFFRSKYDEQLNDTKNHIGYDFDYEWTPKEDDDYLEVFVYDHKGKQKGYVKIAPDESSIDTPVSLTMDISSTTIDKDVDLSVSGTVSKDCDVYVFVDGKLVGLQKGVDSYNSELPTDVLGKHNGFVSATIDGFSVAEQSFTYTVAPKSVTSTSQAGFGEGLKDYGTAGTEVSGNKVSTSNANNKFGDKLEEDDYIMAY